VGCCGVVAAAGTAKLHEAYSSQPQQVAQSLEAALRYTLREQHTLQDSNDRVSMLVKAAGTCVFKKTDGSSSSNSSSAKPGANSPAAKQLFSLLVTCLKAAVQRVYRGSSSSSCSSDGGACTADVHTEHDATIWHNHLASNKMCLRFLQSHCCLDVSLQLLLQSRCLLHVASSAMLMQQHAAKWAAAAEQQACGQEEAAAAAATYTALASEHLNLIAMLLKVHVDACLVYLAAAGFQLPGDAAAAAKALAKLQQQGKALQEQLQPYTSLQLQQPASGTPNIDGCSGSGSSKQQALQQQKEQEQEEVEDMQQQSTAQQSTIQHPRCSSSSNNTASGQGSSASMQDSEQQRQDDKEQQQQQQQQQLQREFQGQQAEQLAQQVQQFAQAICLQLPVPYWCCNPGCSNVQEHSELELVSRKGSRCSGCATARFCSRACQQQSWKGQHAPVCKRIAAARKAQQKG
jgi:hypothetical protein